MLLKRVYDIPEGWEAERSADGTLLNQPPLVGLRVIHTGVHPEQNFSRRLIDNLIHNGLCSLSKGKLVIHTEEEDLEYTILYTPGQYVCCHDGKVIENGTSQGHAQRAYLAANFPGQPSPDASNPSGYRLVNGYECVLDAAQHAQWHSPMHATVSHWRGVDTATKTL